MKRTLIIEKVIAGSSSVQDAALELGVSKPQFLRIKKKCIATGAKSIVHLNKGKVSSHAISKETSNKIIEVYLEYKRETDDGLNSSHFADILKQEHILMFSRAFLSSFSYHGSVF